METKWARCLACFASAPSWTQTRSPHGPATCGGRLQRIIATCCSPFTIINLPDCHSDFPDQKRNMDLFFIVALLMISVLALTFIIERGFALRWEKVIPPMVGTAV